MSRPVEHNKYGKPVDSHFKSVPQGNNGSAPNKQETVGYSELFRRSESALHIGHPLAQIGCLTMENRHESAAGSCGCMRNVTEQRKDLHIHD
jgi:hypothetical protein